MSKLPTRLKPLEPIDRSLEKPLAEAGFSDSVVKSVVNSGYYLRAWGPGADGKPTVSVSDMFYGNKMLSSTFELENFIAYLKNNWRPKAAPPFRRLRVKSMEDIETALNEMPRARYIANGTLTFRGQPKEYKVKRAVPNPFRGESDGGELSVMPGAYRQPATNMYDCSIPVIENMAIKEFASDFEPHRHPFDIAFTHDLMRTEQHYSNQTMGLDLAFDVRSALFFATHQFQRDDDGRAYFRRILRGEHQGIIYLFKFGMPSVTRTEFLIKDFQFFHTHRPERILRQDCGLPFFHPFERNIAVTEIDLVLELDSDFEAPLRTQSFMFPNASDDKFYAKLLELKRAEPAELASVVEYREEPPV